ncbi:MAG: translation initiation factor eIF-1A [Candidatus Thermoplasmatota archaeon]|nr:translation initiation factor eIF-1A [Candidatus Thermoplasmatota archaeon]|tara:strand:- start:904 stop:1419 length:516 start_codon:yes stop_codon:yes gene_type:complete
MSRRFQEKVDSEELARLESDVGPIRVVMPNIKINEMFAIADNILGGRRVSVICADGKTRMARIPGKMRRRQWVREGDLIIVWPWDFQDSKADVKHRYSKTQAIYLSRKGVLPEIVDLFGSGEELQDETDDSGIWNDSSKNDNSEKDETNNDNTESNDDEDINSDDIDDLFG